MQFIQVMPLHSVRERNLSMGGLNSGALNANCTGSRRSEVFTVIVSECRITLMHVVRATPIPQRMTEEQEVFLKHIQKKGLKRTSQRDLILDIFLRTEAHLSSEDLYRLVRQEDSSIGQTTVYRTLKLLAEAGLAREVRFGDGITHYEHNYKHQHHDHMICSECGRIIEFFSAELEAIQDAMAAKHRFQVTQHLLRIIGVCAECRRAMKDPAKADAAAPRVRAKQATARAR
jgi:Fur family ferric uptake transcriptional regulator